MKQSGLPLWPPVAVCEAIEAVSGRPAQIKWVNDVYMEGKKVSGILTEASLSLESGSLDYAVLGIGLNAYPPVGGFPKEIEQIAGTVFPQRQNDGKNHLAAEILNRFMGAYTAENHAEDAKKYRERSLVIGKEIEIISPTGPQKALALDVDEECRLIVRYTDGRIERLSSGEISVKLIGKERRT